MKTCKIFTLVFAVVICTMTSCFRPDGTATDDTGNKLIGYWELVHILEETLRYDIYENGEAGTPYFNTNSYDIACNDGRKEWCIVRFTESTMSIVATDDPELVAIIDLPVPYTFDGKKLVSAFINLDFSESFAEVKFRNENSMEFYILDEGDIYNEESGKPEAHEKYQSWTTYRRVTNKN